MTALRLSAWTTGIYSLTVLLGGLAGYLRGGSPVSLAVGLLASAALAVSSRWLSRGKLAGGFLAGGVALVLGLFFGYRFIATGNFVPGGVLLLASFVALFFVLIGMFSSLER